MYTLPKLNYDYDALEPYIDAQTMELHHSKHHQTYIDKLNAALEGTKWSEYPIEELLQSLDELPLEEQTAVRNNGGGHYNHSFFWQCMKPTTNEANVPSGDIAKLLDKNFGSFEEFKEKFAESALGRFGSGWVWLCTDGNGNLLISSTANQDSPIMTGMKPILGLDVWEHAYYLKYQNRRPEYVDNWWSVVDWEFVSSRL